MTRGTPQTRVVLVIVQHPTGMPELARREIREEILIAKIEPDIKEHRRKRYWEPEGYQS